MKKLLILSLLLPLTCLSQDVDTRVRKNLEEYYQSHFPLKVNLVLSRESALQGDTIFFQANLFAADQMLRLAGSTVLNVSLQAKNQHIELSRSSIRMVDGTGSGQFILPENMADGEYEIVAFHDWMRNEPEDLYVRKTIRVGRADTDNSENKLSFYAEGGNFISGLNNKIVVLGKPRSKGSIANSSNEIVGQFSIDEMGIGFFYFTPASGEKYFGSSAGDSEKAMLPHVNDDGITLLASFIEYGSSLRMIMQMPSNSSLRSKRCYAIISIQGHIFYSANFTMADREFISLVVPVKNATPGIAVVRIYDENAEVLVERLVAISDFEPVKAEITIHQEFSTRNKIDSKVTLTDHNGSPLQGAFSVSVFHNSLPPTDSSRTSVVKDLYYFSDIGSAPTGLLRSYGQADFARLNNYLVSKKWLRQNSDLKVPYLAKDLMLSGRVVREQNQALPDSAMVTFFLQKSATSYRWLLENGKFNFPLFFDFDGTEEVYYKVTERGRVIKDARVVLDNPYQELLPGPAPQLTGFAGQRKLINRSFEFYMKGPRYENTQPGKTALEDLISDADVIVNLDDYILFPTMSETLREIIPSVQHRVIRGRNVVRLFFDDVNLVPTEEPVFFIDGIMVDDVDYFLSLKPVDVSRIKVVYAQQKIGRLGAIADGGVVIVETKIADHAKTIRASNRTFLFPGLISSIPFKEKIHAKTSSRVPDLRTVLYWNADLTTQSNGSQNFSFYASDLTGEYTIRIDGITSGGKPFHAEKKFTVRFTRGD